MRERPLDGILSLTIDYERDELRVVTDDGRVGIQAGAMSGPEGPIDFRTVIFRPAEMTLEMVVPWGNRLEIEVFAHDDQSLRKSGRPVVYLDQNKWVQIALATYRPEGVRPLSELAPTLRIIDLARSRRVLLPISSGHVETGPLWGRQRAHVASLMVGLSRGWVMRDPLRVAASEITRLFGNEPASGVEDAGAVFTLDAGALFAEPVPKYVPRDPALPPETVKLIDSLSSVQAVLAVLLENERTQDPVGVERARQWAAVHHAFAEQLARRRLSGQDRRRQTLNAFISDLGHGLTDIARAHGLGAQP